MSAFDVDLEDSELNDDTASVGGTHVARSDFAYVGDAKDKSTWKLPIHDEAHVRNALARFNQAEIPPGEKKAVARKIVSAAKKYKIDTSGFEEKYLSDATPHPSPPSGATLSPGERGRGEGSVCSVPRYLRSVLLDQLPRPLAGNGGKQLIEIPIAVEGSWVKNGRKFSIAREDLLDMVRNFAKRKNEQLVIDYEHASEMPEVARGGPVPAAGWIHRLAANGALRALIEWTPQARAMIASGQYRFFSPAIDWAARDKETGEAQGATLTSGALTNHPFLEELPAISLSEMAAVQPPHSRGGSRTAPTEEGNPPAEALARQARRAPYHMVQGRAGQGRSCLQEVAGVHQDGYEPGISVEVGKISRTGGAMKKLSFKKLSAGRRVVCDEAGAEIGEVSLAELDLDDAELDEYMAQRGARMSESDALGVGLAELIGIDRATTLGELKQSLGAVKSLGAERARSASRSALLAETIGKDGTINLDGVARLAEAGKIGFADYRAAERVATRLKEAVAAGKVLPCERAYLSRVALADAAAFEQYLAARPVALAQGAVGLAGESPSRSDRPDFELSTLARQVAAEKGISLRDALRLVANENRELAKRYRQELPRG